MTTPGAGKAIRGEYPPVQPRRLAVFSIRKVGNASTWVRAGIAVVNKDGSLDVSLDVLPLDGKLHIRESGEATP